MYSTVATYEEPGSTDLRDSDKETEKSATKVTEVKGKKSDSKAVRVTEGEDR